MIASLLQSIIEKAIASDPDIYEYLAPLNGKIIEWNISRKKSLFFYFTDHGVHCLEATTNSPDLVISATIADASAIAINMANKKSYEQQLKFTGNLSVATQLQKLVSNIKIDLASFFSDLAGESIGISVYSAFKNSAGQQKKFMDSIKHSATEFFTIESDILASEAEVSFFNKKVDKIKHRFNRIENKFKKLQSLK